MANTVDGSTWTQLPFSVMPTADTSNSSASRLASTLPPETHETACSPLRPPNTTATRMRPVGFSRSVTGSTLDATAARPADAEHRNAGFLRPVTHSGVYGRVISIGTIAVGGRC